MLVSGGRLRATEHADVVLYVAMQQATYMRDYLVNALHITPPRDSQLRDSAVRFLHQCRRVLDIAGDFCHVKNKSAD